MTDWKYKHIVNDGIDITIVRTPTNYTGKATISRFKGSYSDYAVQNRRLMNLLLESNLVTGEMVTAGSESYLTVVSKKENVQGTDISIIAHGMLCNAALMVTRTETDYDENGNPSGETTTTIINAAPCRADQVTYRMRQEDSGLLSGTVLLVYAANIAGIALLDKAVVMDKSYRVDDVDLLKYPGAMVLQLSVWTG